MKISIRNLSAVALVGLALTAHSAPFTVPNGTFTMAGGEDWNQNGSGGTVITYETSGGNLDGYGKIDNTAGAWGGVLVAEGGTGANPATGGGIPLGDLGLTAGETYNFSLDMIDLGSGPTMAGMKMESWSETGFLDNGSGDVTFAITNSWDTYTLEYTINPAATRIKFVALLVNNDGPVGFDNVGGNNTPIVTTPPPVGPFLAPNGDFGIAGGASWSSATDGPTVFTYPDDGGPTGVGDGYADIDFTTGAYAVIFSQASLASLGMEAGKTYVFSVDMINLDGPGNVGMFKLEFVGGTPDNTGDMPVESLIGDGSTWETYEFTVTIPPGTSAIKFVPVLTDPNLHIGFDNIGGNNEEVTTPPLPAGGIPNGDFEITGGANWGTTQGTPTFPTTGGNPDGHAVLDGTGAFSVLYAFDNAEVTFASLGLNPGDTYILQLDMKLISGTNIGGIRLEGPDGYVVENFPPIKNGGDWDTYQIELTVPASPAASKIGLRPGGGSEVAFDNVGIFVPPTVPFVAEIKTGTVVSWTPSNPANNYQPQESEDGSVYTDLGPLIMGDSVSMAFDGVESPFYQVLEYEVTAQELLAETSFEEGMGAWLLLDNEVTVFELSDEELEMDLAHTGNWCIRLEVDTGATTVSQKGLIQQALAGGSVASGDQLDFSFWANIESAPVGGTVFNYSVKWRNDTGGVISQTDGSFNTPVGVWTQVSVPGLVAPALTDSAIVEIEAVTGAQAGDSGSVRIDDVSLSGQGSILLPTPLAATTAAGVEILWPTKEGSSYQPKSSTSLSGFTDFGPAIMGDGSVKTVFDVITPPSKFYQVVETP